MSRLDIPKYMLNAGLYFLYYKSLFLWPKCGLDHKIMQSHTHYFVGQRERERGGTLWEMAVGHAWPTSQEAHVTNTFYNKDLCIYIYIYMIIDRIWYWSIYKFQISIIKTLAQCRSTKILIPLLFLFLSFCLPADKRHS